jgi:hypothetical protein
MNKKGQQEIISGILAILTEVILMAVFEPALFLIFASSPATGITGFLIHYAAPLLLVIGDVGLIYTTVATLMTG